MSVEDPWQIREQDYPQTGSLREQLRFCLNYAVLAPSGHNSQPWIFELFDDGVILKADPERRLPIVDPVDRELTISLGAALDHFEISLRYFGHQPSIRVFPVEDDPDLVAAVQITSPATQQGSDQSEAWRRRFAAIPDRRTTRHVYEELQLEERLAEQLASLAYEAGVELAVIEDRPTIETLAKLIAEGDRQQFSDPKFRHELSSWIHSRNSSHHDGLPGDGIGMPDALTPLGAIVVRRFNLGSGLAARDEELATGTPTFLILSTPEDRREDWLRCGRLLSQLLLTATASGITNSYLNQPIEVPSLRAELATAAGISGHPQLLLRAGVGPGVEPSPRRVVDEVLYLRQGSLPGLSDS